MKFLFCLLSILILNKECDAAKSSSIDSENNSIVTKSSPTEKIQDENMIISYSAITRGTRKIITVSKSETIIEDSRAKTPKQTFSTNEKDWNAIKTLVSEIDIKNIPNLKPPSTKSHYDGALAGSLKIELASKTGSVETMSPTFDHGNPPKEISELVNKLLSLTEKGGK